MIRIKYNSDFICLVAGNCPRKETKGKGQPGYTLVSKTKYIRVISIISRVDKGNQSWWKWQVKHFTSKTFIQLGVKIVMSCVNYNTTVYTVWTKWAWQKIGQWRLLSTSNIMYSSWLYLTVTVFGWLQPHVPSCCGDSTCFSAHFHHILMFNEPPNHSCSESPWIHS